MSDKKNEMRENDPLQEKFAGIDRMVTAPPKVVEAVKSGVPIAKEGIQYTPGYHVKKFTKAAVAYAVGVILLLGAVWMLPHVFNTMSPVGTQASDTTTTVTTTVDPRDVISNPEALTPIQLEITQATWANHRELLQNSSVLSYLTIDMVAQHMSRTFLTPCGKGYVVVDYAFIPPGMAYTRELVGSYEFRYTSTHKLSYYENSKFYDLGDAYAAKLFTDDDLRSVWEAFKNSDPSLYTSKADSEWKYNSWEQIVPSDPNTIVFPERYTETNLKAIYAVWDVYKDKNFSPNLRTINDISVIDVSLYGEVIICYTLIRDYPHPLVTDLEETVLGYRFVYRFETPKRVYANKTVYSFQEAYDAGVLTEEDIRTIWEAHKAQNKDLYEQ